MNALPPSPEPVPSAVLIPLYRGEDGQVRVVLVKRSDFGPHRRQISFPGGRREAADASLRETALREAEEETGLPPESVTILGECPTVNTIVSGFIIHPFVGWIDGPVAWKADPREIDEILEFSLDELLSPGVRSSEPQRSALWEGTREMPCFRIRGIVIWGATYRILDEWLGREGRRLCHPRAGCA